MLAGCSLLPPPRVRAVFLRPDSEETLADRPLVVETLSVEAGVATPQVRENALYVYGLLLGRINADRAPEASSGPLRVVVSVHESPFVFGFETRNAVSVETRIFDGPPEAGAQPVVIALYSEETESTITSYRYLYDVLERSLSEVFR